MKVKITHKEKPDDKDWSITENVKKITIELRNGNKAILIQKNEGESPREKFKEKR